MPNKKIKLTFFALLLAVVFVFASCSTPATVSIDVRWKETETHTYTVSLAKKSYDASYSQEFDSIIFANNALMMSDDAYTDEICPTAVSGTFSTSLTTNNTEQTFEATQILTATYTKSLLDEEYGESAFVAVKSFVDQLAANARSIVESQTDAQIVLKSQTETSVTFKKINTQTPISSQRTLDGYYIGFNHQERNDITVATQYDGTKATVTKTENGQTVWNAKEVTISQNSIDINQILLYQRSLDQSVAFPSTPTVTVFNPMTGTSIVVSFGLSSANLLLNLDGTQTPSVANCITAATSLSSGSAGLFVFFNNPKDTKISDVGNLNIFTPVKWQNGFFVYELQSYTAEQINQLKYVSSN